MSKIEWTDKTWNPTTGCDKISPGCKNCYADRMSKRLKAMGQDKYKNQFKLTLHPDMLKTQADDKKHLAHPLRWKKPRKIFVNSMSDLFHVDVPLPFIRDVFNICLKADWHVFQILTKRAERLLELNNQLEWPTNVWMGVSVENMDYTDRIDCLRQTNAHVKFLSLEPLLGPLPDLNLTGIDWIITGGESGPKCRPVEADWIRGIRDQCVDQDVPFFFKQWGGKNKKKNGNTLDGGVWEQFPS
jgi:protein gp37